MTAQRGYLLQLKIGNGGAPEVFAAIGGLKTNNFKLENEIIETNSLNSGIWRKLSDNPGRRFLTISGKGIFTDSSAEELLRSYAFGGLIKNYEITFGNGDKISGAFLIRTYERSGDYDDVEEFFIKLESAGNIIFTAG